MSLTMPRSAQKLNLVNAFGASRVPPAVATRAS
jgi:hypothetical protein